MSISAKKRESNRRNACKSTGPRTPTGKLHSSRNSFKHGLYSNNIVIASPNLSENAQEFQDLVTSLREELSPSSLLQECLVRKIANCIWRSRRVVEAESAHILGTIDCIDDDHHTFLLADAAKARFEGREISDLTEEELADLRESIASRCLIPDRRYTHDLMRYEMRLDRQLARIYRLYWHLKMYNLSKIDGQNNHTEKTGDKTNPPIDSPPTS